MEKVSVVPEVFYDLIARFVPGTIFLLALVIMMPDSRAEVTHLWANPKLLPPIPLLLPVGVIVAWFAGFLMSVASSYLHGMYPGGWNPIRCALDKQISSGYKALRVIDLLVGLPAHVLGLRSLKLLINYQIKEPVAKLIRARIRKVFGVPYDHLPFMLCFDYIRTRGGSEASAVLKTSAESACLRSLSLGFLVMGILSWHFSWIPTWGSLATIGFAMLSSGGASHYRQQSTNRMLFGLLVSAGHDAEAAGTVAR